MKKKCEILKLSIRKKLIIVALLLLLIPTLFLGLTSFGYAKNELDQKGQMILKNSVNSAIDLIEQKRREVTEGKISLEDAQEQVKTYLIGEQIKNGVARKRNERIDLGENGYFVIYSEEGYAVAHPSLEGKYLWNEQSKGKGKEFFVRECISKAESGGGFTYYNWEDPKTGKVESKIAYTDFEPNWGWYISASSYISDFNSGANKIRNSLIYTLFIAIIVGIMIIVIFSNKIVEPIVVLAEYVEEIENGNYALNISEGVLKRKDEVGLLARAIDKMKSQLKENFEKIYFQNKALEEEMKERKRDQEDINYLKRYDILTGLPQKATFIEILESSINKAKYENRFIGIMTLGLDDFKFINEAMGHLSGDELLVQVARRLKEQIKDINALSRITGDEFAIILDNILNIEQIIATANSLLAIFSEPFIIQEKEIFITASIGISICPLDGINPETLIMNATSAQNHVKKNGKNNYQIYSKEMNENAYGKLEMITYLRHALEKEEFVLYYQPQVNLSTGIITGVEALIRWEHPKLGLVYPDKFISVAEKTGMILPISEWVIRKACEQNKKWHEEGNEELLVSVNLSAMQFKKKDLSKTINKILDYTGLSPKHLEVEITEGMLMENIEQAVQILSELKEIGVQVAIDDFGTGYSSLSYLREFPIDRLKIDRSFIMGIPDEDNGSIANIIIELAKSLNLKVVAEGVETENHMDFLKDRRCDEMQGYYFSRPLPAEKITQLLMDRKGLV
ncbi:EAL domain-containing protein [Clostridium bovifaecis]|uniref:EAL domain-containing protein n=1 Tax=Clostridium bovifaecis TaxID=2184719 RepID=A0A6I6F055_9CLOT|nr:EAL domain-containing protein [Clostridium bovifaecis]